MKTVVAFVQWVELPYYVTYYRNYRTPPPTSLYFTLSHSYTLSHRYRDINNTHADWWPAEKVRRAIASAPAHSVFRYSSHFAHYP